MFRSFTLTYLAGCLASVFRLFGFWIGLGLVCSCFAQAKKVSPSVIVASIEGEVSSLNMEDEFKVQLGPTTVGKKINPKTLLTTGKTGKVALLFSNGTLITIKPGSRFYLRTYKQLEGNVEGPLNPGKLEEEPTQSELSAHLDFGDLVVKAPKLKKGSSMKLTSPLGTAGIRGTMFQLMAVRNSVTGDIMGGINLISGDIDFTDTGGNTVSLLSGQSIQLATSKLGAPVASMTGELVDLSSTYGPALTDGFIPPPPQAIFPNLSSSGDSSSEDSESEEQLFNEPTQQTFASSGGSNFEFIHNLATDLFFEIEEAETSSSEFSFESMAVAPTIDIPTPQPEAPVAPPSVTGETLAGGDLEFFQGGHPELKLLGTNNSTDPLVKIFNNGARMQVEMRAPSEGTTWRKIDPWVQAIDFLGNDITSGVKLSEAPKILLANVNSAESEAPLPGASVSYELSYSISDLRGLNTVIFRQVDVVATRPTIEISNKQPSFPWNELDLDGDGKPYDSFYEWVNNQITVQDVRGEYLAYSENERPGRFYISGEFDLAKIGTFNGLKVVAIDWRGLRTESESFTIQVTSPEKLPTLKITEFASTFPALENEKNLLEYGDPSNELRAWLDGATAVDVEGNPVDVNNKISGNEALSPLEIGTVFPGSGTRLSYTIVFEAVDPRWAAGGSNPSMKAQLTTTVTQTIQVVATPPKLELIFHNPRDGLGVSENQDEIRYLVRSKENVSEFLDDGPFAIAEDETNRLDRTLYYKATSYNGFGSDSDITDQVNISFDVPVDSTTLNESSTMTVSVNDQSVRGTSEGAVTVLNPKIKIIDTLAPILRFPSGQSDPFVVEGIMPELALLNGSSKDQVSGNTVSEYYFPDPGIEIIDNYYTTDELHTHNGIDDSKNYTFEYTNVNNTSDLSDRKGFSPVFEYREDRIQTDLDMAKKGDYTLEYSIEDPSENVATLTRSITVEDTQAPVVQLYGSKTMYVDLQAIFNGESRYYDPGAYAIENLYKSENGFFDWLVEDEGMAWSFTLQVCNDLDADTYDDPIPADKDFISNTINGLEESPPTETIRYRFNYILEDRAGNTGTNYRTIELRGSPNLYASIFFLLSHAEASNGTPSNDLIDSENTPPTATLPPLVWEVEVGEGRYSDAPSALVFTDLGGAQREDLSNAYEVELVYLNANETVMSKQNIFSGGINTFPEGSSFFYSVNYRNSQGIDYYISGESGSYTKHRSDSDEWRRVVLRYSVQNGLGNKSVRDMEVRLVDTTPPLITKNTFSKSKIEVGDPFLDPGVVVSDLANSGVTETTIIDLTHPQGLDHNATFTELAEGGFWTTGEFTITYNAEDEFGNQAEPQTLIISVQDSNDPHVAVITHENLNNFNSGNSLVLSYQDANNPSVSPNAIFEEDANLQAKLENLSVHYDNFSFSSEQPFVREDGLTGFQLKASELHPDFLQALRTNPQSLVNSTSDPNTYIQGTDIFGRTFSWYSPMTIIFNDGTSIQDPGILIYESSNSGVELTTSIIPEFFGEDQNQTKNIVINITVTQSNTSARQTIINNARTYTFLDDIKPLISVSPYTDSNSTLIVVEAGENYIDESSEGKSYRMLVDGVLDGSEELLSLRADDVADGSITSSIVRTISDLSDSTTGSVLTSYPHVNHIFKIEYNVQDSEGNAADPVERYLIVKDTTAPIIFAESNSSDNFEIDYLSTSPNVKSLSDVEDHLLSGLVASDYGAQGAGVSDIIDGDLGTTANREKWSVSITKPTTDTNDPGGNFDEGRVYPFNRNESGYVVSISVTDEFGNTSAPRIRSLKVGDYQAPTITLIGDGVIHDFLRYSTNSGLSTETEEISGQDFDATGFGGGMHRIMLDNYTFVDPGAYAEDANSYFPFPEYKDIDQDGIGETYAIRRVQDRAEMEACADIGVIYVYSALNKVSDPFVHYQNLMKEGTYGSESNGTKVPDVEGNNYTFAEENKTDGLHMDVVKLTNEYRVRDGWGNKSDIVERTIYIYESRQFPGFAFYATPLTDGDGQPFEHLYDDGTPNRAYLNDTRKDTDGDGVSDFWEKAFGSNPTDSTSVPNEDLSDPTIYNAIDFNTSNAQ